jgi:hypothetical protein
MGHGDQNRGGKFGGVKRVGSTGIVKRAGNRLIFAKPQDVQGVQPRIVRFLELAKIDRPECKASGLRTSLCHQLLCLI